MMKDAEEIIALQARGESITHIAILTKHGKQYVSKVLSDAGIDTSQMRANLPSNRTKAQQIPVHDYVVAIRSSYSKREALQKVGVFNNDYSYLDKIMEKHSLSLLKKESPKFYGPYHYSGAQPFFVEAATKRKISAHKAYVNGLLIA